MNGSEKRAWMYGIAWLGGGVACGAAVAWLIWVFAHKAWPAGTEAQRLSELGNIAVGLLVLMGLVMLGLTMRNAIRNLKGSAGLVNWEAQGKEERND